MQGRIPIVLLLTLTTLGATPVHAANHTANKLKTLVKAARTAIKEDGDKGEAEADLLVYASGESVASKDRAEAYALCVALERSINDEENLKLYLKQEYDTVRFFASVLAMCRYTLICDSLERQASPYKPRYDKKARTLLLAQRRNLLSGGMHHLRMGNYAEAYPFLNLYLSLPSHPLMAEYTSLAADTLLPRVAYWAVMAALHSDQPQEVLRHVSQAMEGADAPTRATLTENKASCQLALGDTTAWTATLTQGLSLCPPDDAFYLNLLAYCSSQRLYTEGIALSRKMLSLHGSRYPYWLGKSRMHLAMGSYEACIASADSAIVLLNDPSLATTLEGARSNSPYGLEPLAEAYLYKGLAYSYEAQLFAKTMDVDVRSATGRRDNARLRGLYQLARTPLETLRSLIPDQPNLWARHLYDVYLYLNLGDELSELEALLDEQP